MDALGLRLFLAACACVLLTGAKFQTRNFDVTADTPELAARVGRAAEHYRSRLARHWLDRELPNWSRPCRLTVRSGRLLASGETKFQFVRGEVVNWNMVVRGPEDRILDSVLPHEINHTILACIFRRPLPRWADEGAATLFEHRSEQQKQIDLLRGVIEDPARRFGLSQLISMTEYPREHHRMLVMYAQGYALVDFLMQQGTPAEFLEFLRDGLKDGWDAALDRHYAHGDLNGLEQNWHGWVRAGRPTLTRPETLLTSMEGSSLSQERSRPGVPPSESPKSSGRTGGDRRATLPPESRDASRSADPPGRPSRTAQRDVLRQTEDQIRTLLGPSKPNGKARSAPQAGTWVQPNSMNFEQRLRQVSEQRVSAPPPIRTAERESPLGLIPTEQRRAAAERGSSFTGDVALPGRQRIKQTGGRPDWAGFPIEG